MKSFVAPSLFWFLKNRDLLTFWSIVPNKWVRTLGITSGKNFNSVVSELLTNPNPLTPNLSFHLPYREKNYPLLITSIITILDKKNHKKICVSLWRYNGRYKV